MVDWYLNPIFSVLSLLSGIETKENNLSDGELVEFYPYLAELKHRLSAISATTLAPVLSLLSGIETFIRIC